VLLGGLFFLVAHTLKGYSDKQRQNTVNQL